jgi:hypothetical protein
MAQDLTDFFFHRSAVSGRAQAQLALQVLVETTDQEGGHCDSDDIIDILDIKAATVSQG